MKKKYTYNIQSKIFIWQGAAAWHFVGIPKKDSEDIKNFFKNQSKGWGSLPVLVSLGKTKWNTSIFPETKTGTYILPLKAAVRKSKGLMDGDVVQFTLKIEV